MATLNLLPRKTFEITLDDGNIIKGQFGTWALKRFCDRQGIKSTDLGEKLAAPSLDMIFDYILSAVEYSARIDGKPFSYTDINVGQWADELGGLKANSGLIAIFNHSASEDEKKSDPAKGSQESTGPISSDASAPPEGQ